jgi:hypothetical protein
MELRVILYVVAKHDHGTLSFLTFVRFYVMPLLLHIKCYDVASTMNKHIFSHLCKVSKNKPI